MKKAYVKQKDKRAISILKRPYIAATVIGASLCAVVLSLSVPQEEPELEAEKLTAPVASQTPAPEVETPKTEELTVPEQTTVKTQEPTVEQEETLSVGLFSGEKEIRMRKPAEGTVTKAYSEGKPVKSKTMGDWRVHNGVDIAAEQGSEIAAPADGKILRAEMDSLTGYTVSIDHGNKTVSILYNLSQEDRVKAGQDVKAGDIIGTAGNTAKTEMLEDAHVHVEVTKDGEYVNPESLWK